MPTYEYQCFACNHRFEEFQRMADDPIKVCPSCGKEEVKRLVSATSFHLKGSGWYKTDYASGGGAGSSATPASGKAEGAGATGEGSSPTAEGSSSNGSSPTGAAASASSESAGSGSAPSGSTGGSTGSESSKPASTEAPKKQASTTPTPSTKS